MTDAWVPRPLAQLRNQHEGKDIWLIASGKSLDYVDPSFFDNKLTVGLNYAYRRFETVYILTRDHTHFETVYRNASGSIMLAAKTGGCAPNPLQRFPNVPKKPNGRVVHQFESNWYGTDGLNLDVIGTEEMAGGYGSILCAMNVCAHLGAANIILCGADNGTLDGCKYFEGYRTGATNAEPPALADNAHFRQWLGALERQMVAVRNKLREVYGCNVVSLNPFASFALEGHRYEHA